MHPLGEAVVAAAEAVFGVVLLPFFFLVVLENEEIVFQQFPPALLSFGCILGKFLLIPRRIRQVKAAGLLRDYEGRYGASSGSWTTDMFIEAIYRELAGVRQ